MQCRQNTRTVISQVHEKCENDDAKTPVKNQQEQQIMCRKIASSIFLN